MKRIKEKLILFLIIILGIMLLWGCSSGRHQSTKGTESELNPKEELVLNFLYTLAVNYGESPYDVKLYDAKIYQDENSCYYLAVDAAIGGIEDGKRRTFGNEIGFFEGEQITFSNKEASSYKFFTDNNLAVNKGEKLDTEVIISSYSKMIEEKLKQEKNN